MLHVSTISTYPCVPITRTFAVNVCFVLLFFLKTKMIVHLFLFLISEVIDISMFCTQTYLQHLIS